ncbi:DnaJ domain-containing protein [Candidatus Synechococcus calcipolaris G9]|uniref:DnaJ domain-containing protein n=2 Tax=Synechococcus TaxID=1129 RepID=A0ABT6ETT8_9SYNE|nr:DnaJ domain-containing protein [Candidatus Synechococcus calcipolaris G9]
MKANANEIRRRYLKIAKNLHPDSRDEDSGKKVASDLLSKFVNPAYEALSQEKEREEYDIILRLLKEQLTNHRVAPEPTSEAAKALLTHPDIEAGYQQALAEIAQKQYQNLDDILTLTAEISELNLVYLLRRDGGQVPASPSPRVSPPTVAPPRPGTSSSSSTPAANSGSQASAPPTPEPAPAAKSDSYVDKYYRRAEEFLAKNNYTEAIKELRDALNINGKSSRCHALLGKVYLQQGTLTMAKVHFNQALKINPQEAIAIEGMATMAKHEKRAAQQKAKSNPPEKAKGGFFGLFGKK